MLRDPEAVADAFRLLGPNDFLSHIERQPFDVAATLTAGGVRAELPAVSQWLTTPDHDECVGGRPESLVAWLAETWEAVPTAANLEYHAAAVRQVASARELTALAAELARDAGDRIEPSADTAARFADRLAALSTGRDDAGEAVQARLADSASGTSPGAAGLRHRRAAGRAPAGWPWHARGAGANGVVAEDAESRLSR